MEEVHGSDQGARPRVWPAPVSGSGRGGGISDCVRHGPPGVIARLEKGEVVDAAEYYFRIAPLFETASEEYSWINNIVAIGIGQRRADGPIYSVFEVL